MLSPSTADGMPKAMRRARLRAISCSLCASYSVRPSGASVDNSGSAWSAMMCACEFLVVVGFKFRELFDAGVWEGSGRCGKGVNGSRTLVTSHVGRNCYLTRIL